MPCVVEPLIVDDLAHAGEELIVKGDRARCQHECAGLEPLTTKLWEVDRASVHRCRCR